MIEIDLKAARHIREATLKNLITSLVEVEEGPRKVNMSNLDSLKDEVRSGPDGDLEGIEPIDNPARYVNIRVKKRTHALNGFR